MIIIRCKLADFFSMWCTIMIFVLTRKLAQTQSSVMHFTFVDADLELTFDLFVLTLLKIQTLLLWASCVKNYFLAGFVEFLASNAPALNLKDCLNLSPL